VGKGCTTGGKAGLDPRSTFHSLLVPTGLHGLGLSGSPESDRDTGEQSNDEDGHDDGGSDRALGDPMVLGAWFTINYDASVTTTVGGKATTSAKGPTVTNGGNAIMETVASTKDHGISKGAK
jgi:hypothetical protein